MYRQVARGKSICRLTFCPAVKMSCFGFVKTKNQTTYGSNSSINLIFDLDSPRKQRRLHASKTRTIEHYRQDLQAIQDRMEIIQGRWKMSIIALLCNGEFRYSELEKRAT